METLTEPHTLTATLSCMIGMARSLVSPDRRYPEGRAHVLPLLTGALPGVDPNDFSKCMVGGECDCSRRGGLFAKQAIELSSVKVFESVLGSVLLIIPKSEMNISF